ncbi:pectinesterase family protein [Segatella hominis]|uniref:pectinesterase family protein n=1 Tax=Segatella hominis TaxID=2518605 RepID=UPI003AB96ACC
MKKVLLAMMLFLAAGPVLAANKYDNPDTLVVSRDGTGEFRTIDEAIEVCRAFMDYTKVIYVKKGVYKEKLIIPSWLTNITICGEDRDNTIITWDDHANIKMPVGGLDSEAAVKGKPMGTFRTYTLKVQGSYITLKDITIENNAAKLGQAVALHTEGDHILVQNCRLLGNQDTVYTGVGGTRVAFYDCYIEGTTDFIFGPSIAWFQNCEIHSKANSYITAASTPAGQKYGYVFYKCRLTADKDVDKVYLGRPWRPFAATIFMDCELGKHIRPEGWHNWNNAKNEETARYAEYGNKGEGASTKNRVKWSKQLSKKEAAKVTLLDAFGEDCW